MFKKGSKLYSILNFKCPRCHEGDFFVDNNPFHLKKLSQMHEHCSDCKLRYELEPNFFHGSMYVSYGLTVAISIATFVICQILGLNFIVSAIAIFVMLILMVPVTFKFSRIIYINMFESFDDKFLKNKS